MEAYRMDAVLARAYSLHILDVMTKGEESAFNEILNELGISPTTLSRTLKELVDEGFAERRVYGRRTYYSLTEKGREVLETRREGPQFDIDRIAQLVAKRLREEGIPQRFLDVTNEQFVQAVRRRVDRFIDEVGVELQKDLGRDQKGKDRESTAT